MYKDSMIKVGELLDKVTGIKLNDAAAIFGTTSNQAVLNELKQSVVKLADSLRASRGYDSIMEDYELVAKGLDTAGLTGLISESEMASYYELVDDIWANIEKEKNSF